MQRVQYDGAIYDVKFKAVYDRSAYGQIRKMLDDFSMDSYLCEELSYEIKGYENPLTVYGVIYGLTQIGSEVFIDIIKSIDGLLGFQIQPLE